MILNKSCERLSVAISLLAHEIHESRQERKLEFDWFRAHLNFATKQDLKEMEKRIMATQAEVAADLRLVLAQQRKTAAEIAAVQEAQNVAIAKIAELEALLTAGGAVTQELIDAVSEVKTQAQIVDDLIPDVVVPPTP